MDECDVHLVCDDTSIESESEESVTLAVAEAVEDVNPLLEIPEHFNYTTTLAQLKYLAHVTTTQTHLNECLNYFTFKSPHNLTVYPFLESKYFRNI